MNGTADSSSNSFLPDPSPVLHIHSKTPRETKSLLSTVLVKNAENFEPNGTNSGYEKFHPQHVAIGVSNFTLPRLVRDAKKKPLFSHLSKTLPNPSRLNKISSEKDNQKFEPKNSIPRLSKSHSFKYKHPQGQFHNLSAVGKGPPTDRPLSPNSRVNELFLSRSDSGTMLDSHNRTFQHLPTHFITSQFW